MQTDSSNFSSVTSSTSFDLNSVSRGLIKIPQHFLLASHGLIPLTLLIHLEFILVAGQWWGLRTHVTQLDNLDSSLLPAQGALEGWRSNCFSSQKRSCLHFTKDFSHECGSSVLCPTLFQLPLVTLLGPSFGPWGHPGSGHECLGPTHLPPFSCS